MPPNRPAYINKNFSLRGARPSTAADVHATSPEPPVNWSTLQAKKIRSTGRRNDLDPPELAAPQIPLEHLGIASPKHPKPSIKGALKALFLRGVFKQERTPIGLALSDS